MKIAMDAVLKHELDIAYCNDELTAGCGTHRYENVYYSKLIKWERFGLATRCLDADGQMGWSPGPELLQRLREMQAELEEGGGNWGDEDGHDDTESEGSLLQGLGTFIIVDLGRNTSVFPYSTAVLKWD